MRNLFSSHAKRLIVGVLSFILVFSIRAEPINGLTIPNCPPEGYSVYYINGIDNDFQDATISGIALVALALSKAIDSSMLARTQVHTIHNPTDGPRLDIAESLWQALTGTVSNVAAYLTAAWAAVFGKVALPIPSLDEAVAKFVDAFRAAITKVLSTSSVKEVVNYAVPRIADDLNAGRVVVIVAHSQGNFFANEIYDAVGQAVEPSKFAMLKVINVASPSPRHVSGLYVLNNTDVLWQIPGQTATFRGDTVGNYPDSFKFNEAAFNDKLGHNFVSTYLSTVPGGGSTLQGQMVTALQGAFTSALMSAVENCPSSGGFANVNLGCKRNSDGSGTITGLYSADLLPGEQITAITYTGEYLTGSTGDCSVPTYNFPPGQLGPPGEWAGSDCVPTEGLRLHPVYYATCHNPLSGTPRNIWVTMNAYAPPSFLKNTNNVMVLFCRGTTAGLNNGTVPSNARPIASIDTLITCK